MVYRHKTSLLYGGLAISILIFYRELYALTDWNSTANYYSDEGDALPAAEDPSFAPKNTSIFFHETSYYGKLTPRQACSVEAAARANPDRDIYVLFSSPVTNHALKTTCLAKLQKFNNIKLFRVHISEYSKGTVVHPILVNDLKESKYPIQHSADILRMLTFNKWGGVCLETDIVLVKSLDTLPLNWIVKHRGYFVATGIMAFEKDEFGCNLTGNILNEIFNTYDPNEWSITGRKPIQKVVRRMCPININTQYCKGLRLLSYELFYPVHYMLWKLFYVVRSFEPAYSFQMWNFLTRRQSHTKHTPYEMLARRFCPSIFLLYSDQLGV